jgi:SRSO17 transposase
MRLTWREGTRGKMSSRFLALRVRLAKAGLRHAAHKADEDLPVCWLICAWPFDSRRAGQVLAVEPAADTPLKDLALGKLRWRVEHDYCELDDALGGDHFEGRSYRGSNRHVTLISVAHAFLTLSRRRCPPTRAGA